MRLRDLCFNNWPSLRPLGFEPSNVAFGQNLRPVIDLWRRAQRGLVVGTAGRWSGRGRVGSCFPCRPQIGTPQIWLASAQEQHLTGTPSNQIGSRVAAGLLTFGQVTAVITFPWDLFPIHCASWFPAMCAVWVCPHVARDALRRSSPPFRDVRCAHTDEGQNHLRETTSPDRSARRTASWPAASLSEICLLSSDLQRLTRPGRYHLMFSAGGLTRIGAEPADHGCTANGSNICNQISDAIRPDAVNEHLYSGLFVPKT
jgi:hypothetical protein